jgi:hypothetical protein
MPRSPRSPRLPLLLGLLGATLAGVAAAQGDWTLRTPAASPTVVSDHVLVYDVLRARSLLVCGATTASGLLNDTWVYDGTTWTRLTPANSPSGRMRHAGAYDLQRGRVVLFGGSLGTNLGHMNDTWEFDGTNWIQLSPANSPSARNDHAMVYDEARRKVLLFGGHDTTVMYGDTWEWDGANWTQRAPATQPTVRRDFTMVYDRLRQKVVMFGGFQSHALGQPLNDTWEWDGTDWTRITTAASPSPRGGHVLAYDLARQRATLFAGYPLNNETWNYDGANWSLQTVTQAPTNRSGHAMVYDLVRRRLVMVAGYDTAFTNDTWEFSSPSLGAINLLGSGCPGTAGTPSLATRSGSLPWIGQDLTFEVRSVPQTAPLTLVVGASNTQWGTLPLPLDLSVIGMTGCVLRASVDVPVPMTNTNGLGTLTLTVPNLSFMIGQRFFAQALVVDPGANPFGATLANALEAILGAL